MSRRKLTLGSSPRRIAAGFALTGLAFGLVATGTPAMAAVGGGGVGGGTGGTGGAADSYALYALDHDLDPSTPGIQPEQGWGKASIDYFATYMEKQGGWANTTDPNDSMDGTRRGITEACQIAINQAIARAVGPGPHQARVIMVGANYSVLDGTPRFGWGDVGGHDTMLSWFNAQTAAHSWQPALEGFDEDFYGEVATVFKANIPADPQLVCVALNEQEPSIYAQYTLEITTDATDTFTIASGNAPVYDVIHASNGGSSIIEDLTASSILHWTGPDGVEQVFTKQVTIKNLGDTKVAWEPSDVGLAEWDGGSYWFDVQVAKQGQMAAAVDTPDHDPRESWDAWKPNPNKEVVGSGEESGDHTYENINGLSVFPGQHLEYSVGIDLNVPENVRDKITSFAVQDSFDGNFIPNKTSVEFWDSRDAGNPKPVSKKAYELTWDAASNSFTATFTDEWVKNNLVGNTAQGWLTMRFTGQVKDTAPAGSTVKNQAFQIVNGVKIATEVPVVEIPSFTPDKEDLNTDLVDIDKKAVVLGDTIVYRLTMDATPGRDELAYNVHKLGMVDDYDEEYLKADVADIRVTNKTTGADVTDQFNVQILNGVVYAFAKTIDTELPTGDSVAGDPQPANLKAYDEAPINPLTDPIINQDLLGEFYYVTIPTTVIKETDGYVIENIARQNLENSHRTTKIVSNPLKAINPDKDVVITPGGDSIDGSEIPLNSVFNYQLNSSELPADRAYPSSQWSFADTFDRVHDSYTGIWAVYANTDVYNGDQRVFQKGDLVADSAGSMKDAHGDLFTVTFDEASYTLTASATQAYFDLINTRLDLAQSFSVYSKMIRIAPSEKVENVATETYNNVDRQTDVVWTNTPENPAIDVEKFTLEEGLTKGDRDKADQAYSIPKKDLKDGTLVGIRVTNTGDVPLTNVTLTDKTHQGLAGTVKDIVCVDGISELAPNAIGDLAVGESIGCQGTLTGVKDGQLHGDTATATGESIYTGKKVTDEDPWFATTPGALAQTGGTGIGIGALVAGIGALVAGTVLTVRRRRGLTSTATSESADN